MHVTVRGHLQADGSLPDHWDPLFKLQLSGLATCALTTGPSSHPGLELCLPGAALEACATKHNLCSFVVASALVSENGGFSSTVAVVLEVEQALCSV